MKSLNQDEESGNLINIPRIIISSNDSHESLNKVARIRPIVSHDNTRKHGAPSANHQCHANTSPAHHGDGIVCGGATHDQDGGSLYRERVVSNGETPTPTPTQAPPDGGWGWLVLVASVYIATILISLASCFGVLFSDFLNKMKVSSTNVSWILNIHLFLWNLSSSLTGPLCKHLGWRTVGICGSLVFSGAFVVITFVTSPLMIFLMFSIVMGVFGGVSAIVPFLVLPAYFEKRRGMATSLFMAGFSFGQIVIPLVTRALQDYYGFSGAVLIHAGFLLNCVVAYAIFRPINKRNNVNNRHRNRLSIEQSTMLNKECYSVQCDTSRSQSKFKYFCFVLKDIGLSVYKNLQGFKDLRILIACSSMASLIIGFINFISLVPFALVSAGFTSHEAALPVVSSGLGNIVVRLFMSLIADKPWLRKKLCFICGVLLTSGCSFVFPLVMTNLYMAMGTLMVWGVGIAMSNSLFLILLIEVVGMAKYESGVTITCFLVTIISVTVGPAIGFMRDITQEWKWSLWICAMLQLFAALVWLLMPCAKRREASCHPTSAIPPRAACYSC